MSTRNDTTHGTTTGVDVEALARALDRARRDRTAIEPPSASHEGLDLGQAYAIQQAGLRLRRNNGERLVGHKIGLTSAAMQRQLGVDEPDYGYLLAGMLLDGHREPAVLERSSFCAPRVEPEIAFRLAAPLRGPGVTAADVLAATDALAPALEVVDSRIADWRITLTDTVADNASSGAVVLGPWRALHNAPTPATIDVRLAIRGPGTPVDDAGRGDAVLGDPAAAVAWLANTLATLGADAPTLDSGHVVIPGALTAAAWLHVGDEVSARFEGLGAVTASVR